MRFATIYDANVIARHRVRLFQDMGMVPDHLFDTFLAKAGDHIRNGLESGQYVGWLVPDPDGAEKIIAGAGVMLRTLPPIAIPAGKNGEPIIYEGSQALIVNVYTEPEWRRRGYARQLMEAIIIWCREGGINSVVLHASDDGRGLYESLGFSPTSEMRLKNFEME